MISYIEAPIWKLHQWSYFLQTWKNTQVSINQKDNNLVSALSLHNENQNFTIHLMRQRKLTVINFVWGHWNQIQTCENIPLFFICTHLPDKMAIYAYKKWAPISFWFSFRTCVKAIPISQWTMGLETHTRMSNGFDSYL